MSTIPGGVNVKLLSDTNVFKQAIAQLKIDVASELQVDVTHQITNTFENLPNESNGDERPSSGLYLSGDGVVKVVS